MDTWEPTLSTGPLLGIAVAAIAVILVLVIYFKLHAFLTLLVISALTALGCGHSPRRNRAHHDREL